LLLTVKQLAKAYGYLWALRQLDLSIGPGQLVALLGPNGAGKTTLLRLLAGLTPPSAGVIELDGQPVAGNATVRSQIGLLAPADHLYDQLTVLETCASLRRSMINVARPASCWRHWKKWVSTRA